MRIRLIVSSIFINFQERSTQAGGSLRNTLLSINAPLVCLSLPPCV